MKTLQALTLFGCLALSRLFAVEPPPAAHPLFQTIRAGEAGKMEALMQDAAALKARDEYGNTPLMAAAWLTDAAVLERLLKAGADVNASNKAGAIALLYASTFEDKARLLIASGADVKAHACRIRWRIWKCRPWPSASDSRPSHPTRSPSSKTGSIKVQTGRLAQVFAQRGVEAGARRKNP